MEIGPVIPPYLRKAAESNCEGNEEGLLAGPKLPSKQGTEEKKATERGDVDQDTYGPALPPGFQQRPRYIGPALPGRLKENRVKEDEEEEEEEEETIIGPMPPSATDAAALLLRTKWDIESRSQAKKDQMTGKKDEKMQRESWMTELPPELSKNFGLGPRTFRTRAAEIGDRSVWTDTPSDKARKAQSGTSSGDHNKHDTKKNTDERTPWEIARDEEMSQQVQKHNKRCRGESLLDIHKKKIKKQKEEEKEDIPERRPFDRELDLGVSVMDPAKRKAAVDKSRQLGSRFQHSSSGSSYL